MIRKLIPDDREIYIEMAMEFYGSDAVSHAIPRKHHEDAFSHMVTTGIYLTGYYFEYDGCPAGFGVAAKTYSPEAGGMVLWIEDLYVREAYRGKGIASDFFRRLEKDYSGTAVRWRLEIMPENEGAKRLYKRNGFEECPYLPMIRELYDM
ncbi:MAG: GNAT family N-acetyltransferase [Oscillospiraceae bacterium]|nr:GNAT family N-acetyltransferase [Oscillospiraceae bacterium]